ncbi:MAG: hypothetical protein GY929_26080 [Actinomycetia bacterium]|nr:hypothetical protein [Actinomycetes bacterium]
MRRALPVLMVALIVSAGCSSSGDSVATESPASPTTAGATTSSSPTRTSAATTSTPDPSTTTTPPATTTTTAAPAGDPTSLVISRLYVVGAWDGTGWLEIDPLAAGNIPAEEGDSYQVSMVGQPGGGTTVGGAPEEVCEPMGIHGIPTFPELFYEFGEASPIAVRADWDIAPRSGELLDPAPTVYVDAARDFLISRGIADPVVELEQVVRVDLEGDGVDEVIMVGERFDQFFQVEPGEYSFVLLRKVVEGEVQTAVLGAAIPVDETEGELFLSFRLSSLADLNGDGQLEIVTNETYYEGTATVVWDYVNDDLGPVVVMSAGCGA